MLDSTCLFCKIIRGEIPAAKVYEDEHTLVFKDIAPKAPVHLLAVPKTHRASVHEIPPAEMTVVHDLFAAVKAVVDKENLAGRGGYRLVVNSGPNAGQAVAHIHVHILAGRQLGWPPG